MNNHKQETIDGFVKAVLPSILSKNELDEAYDSFFNTELSNRSAAFKMNEYIFIAYQLAEMLYKKHSETCAICQELKV
jgi:hypothetical protein